MYLLLIPQQLSQVLCVRKILKIWPVRQSSLKNQIEVYNIIGSFLHDFSFICYLL